MNTEQINHLPHVDVRGPKSKREKVSRSDLSKSIHLDKRESNIAIISIIANILHKLLYSTLWAICCGLVKQTERVH